MKSYPMLVILAACLVTAACSSAVGPDPKFEQSLRDAARDARTVKLDSLTDFDWTRVFLFRDSWKGADVNGTVGAHVMDDSSYQDESRLLWVFVKDNQFVRATETSYYGFLVVPRESEWGSGALLEPPPDRPGWLQLSSSG